MQTLLFACDSIHNFHLLLNRPAHNNESQFTCKHESVGFDFGPISIPPELV